MNDSQAVVLLGDGGGGFQEAESRFPFGTGLPRWIVAADLNGDGRPDLACPKHGGTVTVILNLRGRDADRNGVLDACESSPFFRGDFDGDGRLSVADAVAQALRLFQGGRGPACFEAADADDDGAEDLSDAIAVLRHLFQGGAAPPAPGPPSETCSEERGREPFLGCAAYTGCP